MNKSILARILIACVVLSVFSGLGFVRAAEEPKKDERPPAQLSDDELGEMFLQAVMLHKYGRYDEAETLARRIQSARPDNRDVKQLLSEIARARQRSDEKRLGPLERKLSELIVPEVNFREANPKDVIEFLSEETKKLNADKKPINFVWLVPEDAKLRLVSLKLQKIPLLDVLHYVTELSGLRYRVDPHAVVIYKEAPPAAAAPATPPPATEAPSESNVKSR
jgi:hypothetical protein